MDEVTGEKLPDFERTAASIRAAARELVAAAGR
jgi:hypothetical protein